jgi:lipopolysaccharide transport system ATP-binding protein
MATNAIEARGLGKCYALGGPQKRHDTLMDQLASAGTALFRRKPKGAPFWALKDATFDIPQGENVGIIGLNGAGKSTLLKILSRIVQPAAGHARIVGRVGALLEVGTGFHWELTGRENTYLYGSILGMSKQEINQKFDAIVDFADIEKFIDTPVKRYSSGMYVRLAFSVAAQLEPEILLLDEVLSVGDVAFQRKCMDYAKKLAARNSTILFVSHSMHSIKTMCPRVIYLRKGQVQYDGATDEGIRIYEEDGRLSTLDYAEEKPDKWPIRITDIEIADERGEARSVFDIGERMRLRLTYDVRETVQNPNFIIAFMRSDGIAACNYCTELDGASIQKLASGKGVLELLTPPLKLVSEVYTIHILVRERGFQEVVCSQIGATFHVRHDVLDRHFGVFHDAGEFRFLPAGTQEEEDAGRLRRVASER